MLYDFCNRLDDNFLYKVENSRMIRIQTAVSDPAK